MEKIKGMGNELVGPIQKILNGNDGIWKYWIISGLLTQVDVEVLTRLKPELQRLVTNPTEDDLLEEVNIEAQEVLNNLQ